MATLQSCKDATLEPVKLEPVKVEATTLENSVELKDGRLKFNSGKSLDKYIADLEKNNKTRKGYDVKVEGFKSVQEKYEELKKYDIGKAIKDGTIDKYSNILKITMDKNGIKDYDIAIQNHLLSAVLNEDGLVQVGDKVIKMDGDTSKRVSEKYISDLFLPSSVNVEVFPYENKLNVKNSKNSKVNGNWDTTEYIPYDNLIGEHKRFRTVAEIYQTIWSSTIYLEFNVTHKRDTWYGWAYDETSGWQFWASGLAYFQTPFGNYGSQWGTEYQGTTGSNSTDAVWWSRQQSDNGTTSGGCYGEIYGKWEALGHNYQPYRSDMAGNPNFLIGKAWAQF